MRGALRSALAAAFTLTAFHLAEGTALADAPACTTPKTTCSGNAGYYASSDDLTRLTAVADPILRDVRACLDKEGGKHVPAVLVMRWNSEGAPVEVKIDVPGYESLACVQKAQTKLSTLQNPHETAIRCEFGCPKPAPPPPPPAPAVAPAPTTTTTAPTPPPPQSAMPIAPSAPPPPVTPAPHYEKVWYGYQTLIADAVTVPLFAAGVATSTKGLTTAGYVGFILGPPAVHMVHGKVGIGFASMGIRIIAPLTAAGVGALAGVIGYSMGHKNSTSFDASNEAEVGAWIGVGAGVLVCALIDAFAFGYEKHLVEPNATKAAVKRPAPPLSFTPSFAMQKDGASLGLVGQF